MLVSSIKLKVQYSICSKMSWHHFDIKLLGYRKTPLACYPKGKVHAIITEAFYFPKNTVEIWQKLINLLSFALIFMLYKNCLHVTSGKKPSIFALSKHVTFQLSVILCHFKPGIPRLAVCIYNFSSINSDMHTLSLLSNITDRFSWPIHHLQVRSSSLHPLNTAPFCSLFACIDTHVTGHVQINFPLEK